MNNKNFEKLDKKEQLSTACIMLGRNQLSLVHQETV